jgi:argininosuccinate lyase
VIGDLTALLVLLKGLPLAYQRDLQEDKLPLFASAATLEASLGIMTGLVDTLGIDPVRMRAAAGDGFITATAIADTLVRQGVPFRAAHQAVGRMVAAAEQSGATLETIGDDAIRAALTGVDDPTAAELAERADIGQTVRAAAAIDVALAGPDVIGGTAPERVARALADARARLGDAGA